MAKFKRLYLIVGLLLPIHLLVLGASFFSPYGPDVEHRDLPFAPPTSLHWIDVHGRFHLRPFIYPYIALPGRFGVYQPDVTHPVPVCFWVHKTDRDSSGRSLSHWHLFGTHGGAPIFLLGSDEYGRDEFSRMLYAGQVSLFAGVTAAMVSLGLAFLLGSLSGFYGGLADIAVMRLADLFFALPWLYLLFALRAFLPLQTPPRESLFLVIMAIGLLGWARPARLVRGAVLSAKKRNYVLAARGFGASDTYLLRRHILPQTWGILLTQAGLLIPQYLLAEVTLSYVGLGVGEPTPSIGTLLAEIQIPGILPAYWWMLLPGLALIPLLAGYYWLADALHERAGFISL